MTEGWKDATAEAAITSCGRRRAMDEPGQPCAECLAPVSAAVNAHNGASLCPQCAAQGSVANCAQEVIKGQ